MKAAVSSFLSGLPVRVWVLMLVALGMVGCSAPISPTASMEARYTVWSYMRDVKKDKEADTQLPPLASGLSEKHFTEIRKQPMPETLPAMRVYEATLAKPVRVSPNQALASADMSQSLKTEILTWYGNKEIEINGSPLVTAWQQEIGAARDQTQRLDAAKAQAFSEGKRLRAEGKFDEADTPYAKAAKLDADDKALLADYGQMQRDWLLDRLSKLTKAMNDTIFPALQEPMARFHQKEGSSIQSVEKLISDTDAARKQIIDFGTWAASREEFSTALPARAQDVSKLTATCADIRGKAWEEHLWLLAEQGDFWGFYQQTRRYVDQKADGNRIAYNESELADLKKHVQSAYVESMPKAEAHYSLQASKSRTQRADGLALLYWRVASELLDFGQQIGCKFPPETLTMHRTLDASMKPVRVRVREGFERRILIPLFESDNLDGRNVTRGMETMLRKTFEMPAGPSTFCGISVQRIHDTVETKPWDYRLGGKNAGIFVDAIPPVESERKEMPIGREIIRETNQDPRTKDEYPHVYRQEVWVYERITTRNAKKCTVRADFTVEHGSKPVRLWDIDEVFGEDKSLAGSTLVDNALDWKFVLIRKQESPRQSDMLPAQGLPKNRSAALSLDREVQQCAANLICQGIASALIPKAEAFPFEDILGKQQASARAGEAMNEADFAGRYVEYLCLITRADEQAPQTVGNGWLTVRNRIMQRLTDTVIPAWKSHKVVVPENITSAWTDAVKLAHEVKLP